MSTDRKKRPGWLWPAVGIAAVAVILGAMKMFGGSSGGGNDFRRVTVEKGDIEITILATGMVQPENRVEIKPPIAGRVERVLVEEGAQVRKGQVLAWMSSTERAAMLDAARSKGMEEAKQWEEMYRPTPILAPIKGAIISRKVESGQTFTTSDAVLVMSDRLTVKANVDETDIAQIKTGQKARIVLDAYQDKVFPAHVVQIAHDATTVNNVTSYVVDVLPEQAPDFMRSGMTANVTYEIDSREGVLLLPVEAVKREKGRSVVKVAGEGGVPVEKEIKTGVTDGKNAELLEGLNEGEVVLVPRFTGGDEKREKNRSPLNPMGGRRRG